MNIVSNFSKPANKALKFGCKMDGDKLELCTQMKEEIDRFISTIPPEKKKEAEEGMINMVRGWLEAGLNPHELIHMMSLAAGKSSR